jgi:hypothetical protein
MISALIETTKPSISRAQVERIPGLMVPKGARMRVERRERGKQGRGWWILAYLFGGTILLGFAVMFHRHGFGDGLMHSWWVFRNLNSPDEEAIKFPWAFLASAGGLAYMWVFPGLK